MPLNKIMLIGNVGQDPEVKDLPVQNETVKSATFRLATTEKYTDRNGEKHERTEWHQVECWRKTAELIDRYVQKGTLLYVEGKLRTRSYQASDGSTKYVTYVEPDSIQLLGNTRRADDATVQRQQTKPSARPSARPSAPGWTPGPKDDDDSDLPF